MSSSEISIKGNVGNGRGETFSSSTYNAELSHSGVFNKPPDPPPASGDEKGLNPPIVHLLETSNVFVFHLLLCFWLLQWIPRPRFIRSYGMLVLVLWWLFRVKASLSTIFHRAILSRLFISPISRFSCNFERCLISIPARFGRNWSFSYMLGCWIEWIHLICLGIGAVLVLLTRWRRPPIKLLISRCQFTIFHGRYCAALLMWTWRYFCTWLCQISHASVLDCILLEVVYLFECWCWMIGWNGHGWGVLTSDFDARERCELFSSIFFTFLFTLFL